MSWWSSGMLASPAAVPQTTPHHNVLNMFSQNENEWSMKIIKNVHVITEQKTLLIVKDQMLGS